jgi:succinyl-CoA synthetase alpha subunit
MVLLDPQAEIMVQGITGREASAMVADMLEYGSRVVAGVTPGKGGQEVHGKPVYDTVAQLKEDHAPTVSVISVPAPAVLDASLEAIGHGIELCLIMSERVPRRDTSKILVAAGQAGCQVIGPNSLGLIRPHEAKLGTIGGRIDNVQRSFTPGSTAILSRSGGMTTEIASFLTSHGIGQSIAVGVGGDPIVGANFVQLVAALENDPATRSVVLYGEPGGTAEEDLAEMLLQRKSRLRINAFLSGRFVDDLEGVRFGHAAVIVERAAARSKARRRR